MSGQNLATHPFRLVPSQPHKKEAKWNSRLAKNPPVTPPRVILPLWLNTQNFSKFLPKISCKKNQPSPFHFSFSTSSLYPHFFISLLRLYTNLLPFSSNLRFEVGFLTFCWLLGLCGWLGFLCSFLIWYCMMIIWFVSIELTWKFLIWVGESIKNSRKNLNKIAETEP